MTQDTSKERRAQHDSVPTRREDLGPARELFSDPSPTRNELSPYRRANFHAKHAARQKIDATGFSNA
jgi:hypothetical protein